MMIRTTTARFKRSSANLCGIVPVLVLTTLLGCDRGPHGPPRVTTVPVTGQVNVDGKPQAMIGVRAKPLSGETATSTTPNAFTDQDGRFSLTTYESGDGVPVGDYKLTFQWGQINMLTGRFGGDKFNGKYIDAANSAYEVNATETDANIDVGIIELNTDDLPESKENPVDLLQGGDG